MMISAQSSGTSKCRHGESGYTLIMVVFLVATSLIISAAVVPNLLTQGRREREQEAIWRGEQYERAIGLYYRKFGRYPTKIEDLTQQTNGVRFLRQAYKDPMNKDDGSWRFIYVNPTTGQLIGSVHSQSLLQSALTTSGMPGLSLPGAGTQPPPPPGSATGSTAPGQTGPGQATGSAATPDSLQAQPQPLTGDVIGGNIAGIGSKVKEDSLLVYQGGTSYDEWEFIYNPTQQGGIPGQAAPVNPAAPANPGATGQQPAFSIPSFTTPGTTAPTTPPPGM